MIQLITKQITKRDLRNISKNQFGTLVKGVVDIEQRIMAIGGEFHSDEEVFLMEQHGSKRENTWGINLYPDMKDEWVEFDSMINLKPAFNNRWAKYAPFAE